MEILSKRLQKLRTDLDMTQEDIALILKVSRPGYTRYETGVNIPPLDKLISLAEFYGVSLDYLIGRTDEPAVHGCLTEDSSSASGRLRPEFECEAERSVLNMAEPRYRDQKEFPKTVESLEAFVRAVVDV